MRSFWWFKENSIAGMARPGFNSFHFNDLQFTEAILLSWLGRHSSGKHSVQDFHLHLQEYAPKTFQFYGLDADSGPQTLNVFKTEDGILHVMRNLTAKTPLFENLEYDSGEFHLSYCEDNLVQEVSHLKERGIQRIVTLTESHHSADLLSEYFKAHHLSVPDLEAPQVDQAHELKEILVEAAKCGEKVAVHCLAGIGRTSTMIMAAHILMGHEPSELEKLLMKKNPAFKLTGSQERFIRSLT